MRWAFVVTLVRGQGGWTIDRIRFNATYVE
jgi:hypothetical protein